MNISDLKKLDLNLLVVFHVLMQERHVTRAAESLRLSQSAVSAALGRLRLLLDDPLFERGRHGMVPTSRAFEISGQVALALGSIAKVFRTEENFNPRNSTRTLHIAMSDDISSVVAPWLLRQGAQEHWQVKFAIHQTTSRLYASAMQSDSVDMTICATPPEIASEYRSRQLFAGSYSCLYSTRYRSAHRSITEEEFKAADHIRVSFEGNRGFMDDLLESSGIGRNVPITVDHFSGLISVLAAGSAIATIPDFAAEQSAKGTDLAVSPVPVPVPRFTVSAIWRAADDNSPEIEWLIAKLGEFSPD